MNLLRAFFMTAGALAIASAQDGLSAVASRNISLRPTDAVIAFSVQTDNQKTLDDVLAKVKDVGLAVENLATITSIPSFTSIPGVPSIPGSNTYTFHLTVPLAQATATLQRMRQFSAANTDLKADVGVTGVTASVAAIQEAQRSNFPDLYREAKARAEEMARAAGLSAGRVLAVTDSYQYAALAVTSLFTNLQLPVSVAVRLAIE